jgi:hypothetical protein
MLVNINIITRFVGTLIDLKLQTLHSSNRADKTNNLILITLQLHNQTRMSHSFIFVERVRIKVNF